MNWSFALQVTNSSMKVKVSLSPVWLCHPVDWSQLGSFEHGILQARILKWVACPPSGNLPNPGIEPSSPALQADSKCLLCTESVIFLKFDSFLSTYFFLNTVLKRDSWVKVSSFGNIYLLPFIYNVQIITIHVSFLYANTHSKDTSF